MCAFFSVFCLLDILYTATTLNLRSIIFTVMYNYGVELAIKDDKKILLQYSETSDKGHVPRKRTNAHTNKGQAEITHTHSTENPI